MWANWALFFILIIVAVIIVSRMDKPLEKKALGLVFLSFFMLYFLVLIVLTTISNQWDLFNCQWSGSSWNDDCNPCNQPVDNCNQPCNERFGYKK